MFINRIIFGLRVLITLLVIRGCRARHDIGETTQFLNVLIENEMVPCVLNMKMCWKRQESVQVMQSINSPIQMLSESNTIDLPLGDLTNKIWFVVDMHCNGSQGFLEQVALSFYRYKLIIDNAFKLLSLRSLFADRKKIFSLSLQVDSA